MKFKYKSIKIIIIKSIYIYGGWSVAVLYIERNLMLLNEVELKAVLRHNIQFPGCGVYITE
jgi:hypothetical protein